MPSTSISGNGTGTRGLALRALPLVLLTTALLVCACAPLQLSRPVFKIGLLAPFEGPGRATGYEALYAVKLALREKNTAGGAGGWSVELVALDNDEQLAETGKQAHVLSIDPDVMRMLVVVHDQDRGAVGSALAGLGLPFDVLPAESSGNGSAASASFVEAYRAISGGITPGDLAVRTYGAAQQTLASVERQIRAGGRPAR